MYIESVKNKRVKQWKKLHTRKEREKTKTYLVESFHLVEEALKSQADVKELILQEGISSQLVETFPEENVFTVTAEVAQAISGTETTQGIFAVLSIPEIETIDFIAGPYLLLDRVQDPGNVGTMVRTAVAAGFAGVILGEGCADLYNAKTLRSAQGSHFHLNVIRQPLVEVIEFFKSEQVPVYGSALDEKALSYTAVQKTEKFALIMGNEGQGISKDILDQTTDNLYIPIKGRAESLNVAVAAGILMFELQK